MAALAVTMEGMLVADMLQLVMLRVDTPVSVLAVRVLTILRGRHVETRVMRVARAIGMAAVTGEVVAATGEAVIGEAVTGIRRMDILGSGIKAWVTVIPTTDIIRGDITLTATDIGRT